MTSLVRPAVVCLLFFTLAALMLLLAQNQLLALEAGAQSLNSNLLSTNSAQDTSAPEEFGGFGGEINKFNPNQPEGKRQKAERFVGTHCGEGAIYSERARTKECREIAEQLKKILHAKDGLAIAVWRVVAEQLFFAVLAVLVMMFAIVITILIAVLIDYLREDLGARFAADTINRLIDTIPYTVWLIVMGAVFSWIVFTLTHRPVPGAMQLQQRLTILLGQGFVYLGVALLLMPLFLNFLLEAIRAARRNGVFDMVAMDGMSSYQAYLLVLKRHIGGILLKAILFGTLFILMFDPLFERLSQSRSYQQTHQLEGVVPMQAYQSTFYQWALLRFDDERHPLWKLPETRTILADIAKNADASSTDRLSLMVAGANSANASGLGTVGEIMRDFAVFPGLMLDPQRWRALQDDCKICSASGSETCRAIGDLGTIGERVMRIAIRGSFASAYYYVNIAIILFIIGPLAAWEYFQLYRRRMEQV